VSNRLSYEQSVTGGYYTTFRRTCCDQEKNNRALRRGVLLLQDNAPAHKRSIYMGTSHKVGFKILKKPPCSPYLTSFFQIYKNTFLVHIFGTMK
jgi:hypothetical protein